MDDDDGGDDDVDDGGTFAGISVISPNARISKRPVAEMSLCDLSGPCSAACYRIYPCYAYRMLNAFREIKSRHTI